MVFNSYIFIFLFLPLVVAGYFGLNKYCYGKDGQAGLIWLLGMSLWFYAYDVPVFLLLLIGSIVLNYIVGKKIISLKQKKDRDLRRQKTIMVVGIVFNLMPLIGFKYTNFILECTWDIWYAKWNLDIPIPLDIAIPVGISFYTFMQIAYIVDCYREENNFDYTFLEYALYVVFFPKIVMGPIALHSEIIPQFRERTKKQINYDNLSKGLYVFTLGLSKKVLVADTLAKLVNTAYKDIYYINTMTAIVVMFCYTLQLYFDFSGYCDMAAGCAKMLNIELPINFNSPYKAKSISEFWDRWHMTLTRFFTRYVYIPLGGSRKGKIRTYINTIIVFLLSGLWHGADWGFVIWGALHGAFMVIEKIGKDLGMGVKKLTGIPRKITDGIRWLVTFLILNITWMFFRAGEMHFVNEYFSRLFSGGWECQPYVTQVFNDLIEVRILKRFGLGSLLEASMDVTIWAMIILLILVVVFCKNAREKMLSEKYHWGRSMVTLLLIVWCVISLSDVSEFLYFNF